MEKITKVLLAECGKNIKFQLGEEQLEILTDEFDTILAQMKFLHEIPGLESVEPMTFPYKNHQLTLDEDIPATPVEADIELSNTKNRLGNQVKIPKVLG